MLGTTLNNLAHSYKLTTTGETLASAVATTKNTLKLFRKKGYNNHSEHFNNQIAMQQQPSRTS